MAIQINPTTGLKEFNTRAAKAAVAIAGQGYGVESNEALKTLPEAPPGAAFNAEEQARYRDFKEARRGAADYIAMEGEFSHYLTDLYSDEPVPRESLSDECEILVVGAGFAGLLLWHKLQEAGFTDVRFCEKGGDVGGTWYWNRYPGVACDVEAYSYLPLLEEMGYIPSMKFASGFEIMEYCQNLAERFGFYEHCLFHTTVTETRWEAAQKRWVVSTQGLKDDIRYADNESPFDRLDGRDKVLEAILNTNIMGGFTLLYDSLKSREYGSNFWASLLGPAASNISNVLEGGYDYAIKGNSRNISREIANLIPLLRNIPTARDIKNDFVDYVEENLEEFRDNTVDFIGD